MNFYRLWLCIVIVLMEVVVTSIVCAAGIFWFVFLRRYGRGPCKYIIRKQGEYDFDYKKFYTKTPPLTGFILRLTSRLVNSAFGEFFLANHLLRENKMLIFRTMKFSEQPTFYPFVTFDGECAIPREKNYSEEDIEKILKGRDDVHGAFKFHSMSSYLSLYKSGNLTPSEAAERALSSLKEISKTNAIVRYDSDSVRKAAAESTERYKNHTTLSPVDGILVVIKDEFSVKGFKYSCGTSFLGRDGVAADDSEVVAKLREYGVVILAVANMHELGIGTSGNNCNPGFGACRNPYNTDHYTGGSSSGSAAAVASGLCCAALGTDGGGSIRIPSAYCGVVGLKATFARINLCHVSGLSNTVGHCGPICSNVRDTAVMYALLSGPHPGYPLGMRQPKLVLPDFSGDLTGMKIGIDRRYFKDCRPDVYEVCSRSLDHLVACGAKVETIEIPEISYSVIAHRLIILSEMSTSINHGFDFSLNDLTCASRVLFKAGSCISACDYIQANKQRTRIIEFLQGLFENIDAIVTPTTGHCAPPVLKQELPSGMMNAEQDSFNMRYAGLGNLTGCPSISVPVGYNSSGLPVGLQLMAAWWHEDIVLKIAEAVERRVQRRRPQVYVDLLDA